MAYQRSPDVQAIMTRLTKKAPLKGFVSDEECNRLVGMVLEVFSTSKELKRDDELKLREYLRLDRSFTVPEGDRICEIVQRNEIFKKLIKGSTDNEQRDRRSDKTYQISNRMGEIAARLWL